ncbi:MAG: hypothetical protein MUF50_02435 [Planctomycetes bacterium]|jgi:actin-related protein|nr:hypothetical protein [Planctomycetota bacterium]
MNEYLTKVEAKQKYLTKRRFKFEQLNPNHFLSKDEAEYKYLTKEEFKRQLHMEGFLPKYKFNQFLIGIGIVIFLTYLFNFNRVGVLLLEIIIVTVFLKNIQQTMKENQQYNKTIKSKKQKYE